MSENRRTLAFVIGRLRYAAIASDIGRLLLHATIFMCVVFRSRLKNCRLKWVPASAPDADAGIKLPAVNWGVNADRFSSLYLSVGGGSMAFSGILSSSSRRPLAAETAISRAIAGQSRSSSTGVTSLDCDKFPSSLPSFRKTAQSTDIRFFPASLSNNLILPATARESLPHRGRYPKGLSTQGGLQLIAQDGGSVSGWPRNRRNV